MLNKLTRLSLLLVLLLITQLVMAQRATVRGFVYDNTNGEPIIFTNVYMVGTAIGASTDINGFFTIPNIPAGDYTIFVTYLGYDTIQQNINLQPDEIRSEKFFLNPSDVRLNEVVVSADREEKETEVRISTIKVNPKLLKKIPNIGAEPDIAQYIQILPGVVSTGDQGGQLYIRGGSPIQNKIMLDGMTVYNPFHSIGFFSVFETDILKNVEVLSGGFGAEYGERISAIVDITTIDGNKRNFEGKVGVSPFMAKVVLEGPLKKIQETGGSSSFVVSAKHSYLDESSKIFYEYVDSTGLPFTFTDLYGKLSLYGENGSKVSIFGFNHQDDVNFLDNAGLDWNSFGAGTQFVLIPGQQKTVISGNFSFSDYKINLVEEQLNLNDNPNSNKRFSNINGFNLGADFTNYVTNGEIKYGFDIVGFKTDFVFFNSIGSQIRQKQNTTELGAYAKYRKKVGRIVLEPSVRIVNYGSLGTTQVEPRMGLKANISDDIRFKAAGGLYSQNLISSKSDRDVVNLFTGFLSGPETTLEAPDGERTNANLQKATHAIAGFEFDLTNRIELNVEGYLKDFTQLINISRDKLFPDDPDYVIEEGQAYGADIWMKYENQKTFIWAVYSLGFNDRFDGTRNYSPHFDRRHNVNLVLSRSLGPNNEWEASARWNYGSGLPFTRTQGFYQLINFSDGIDTDYVTENGNLGILFEEDLNKGSLSDYHRFDVALKRTFNFANKTKLDATFSVTNLYDRENIFFVDRITNERVYQLPILPSIGLSYSFQ